MQILRALVAVSLIFLCSSLGVLALRLTSAVRALEIEADLTLEHLTQDADELKQMTSATLFSVGDAAHEVAEMAREERQSWNRSAEQTAVALGKTNAVLDQLALVVGNLDSSQAQIAAAAKQSLEAIPPLLAESQDTIRQAGETVASLDRVIQDQNIPLTLAHVNGTAEHLEATSASLDAAVKRMTRPQSLVKSLFVGLLDVSYKLHTFFP
jgi:hypothetical protein